MELLSLATRFHSPLQCGHHIVQLFSVSHNFSSVVVPSNVGLMPLCQRTLRYCMTVLIFMQEFDKMSLFFFSFVQSQTALFKLHPTMLEVHLKK